MAEPTIYRYVPHRRTQARLAGQAPLVGIGGEWYSY
jgi:hypothetical protein